MNLRNYSFPICLGTHFVKMASALERVLCAISLQQQSPATVFVSVVPYPRSSQKKLVKAPSTYTCYWADLCLNFMKMPSNSSSSQVHLIWRCPNIMYHSYLWDDLPLLLIRQVTRPNTMWPLPVGYILSLANRQLQWRISETGTFCPGHGGKGAGWSERWTTICHVTRLILSSCRAPREF